MFSLASSFDGIGWFAAAVAVVAAVLKWLLTGFACPATLRC
jgi:hypothetical protein